MHHVAVALWAFTMSILSLVTIVGNLAVLLSFYIDKNIRQPSNYFIFSLAVSDLVSSSRAFHYWRIVNTTCEEIMITIWSLDLETDDPIF